MLKTAETRERAEKFISDLKSYQHITTYTVANAELQKFSWLHNLPAEEEDWIRDELHSFYKE